MVINHVSKSWEDSYHPSNVEGKKRKKSDQTTDTMDFQADWAYLAMKRTMKVKVFERLIIFPTTLPKTNCLHLKNRPFQKESSLSTTNFQVQTVSFREGKYASSPQTTFLVRLALFGWGKKGKGGQHQIYQMLANL